jgi:adenylate cyclase
VLDGLIKRGDGEDVHAVIWFSDLRESTRLSETLPRATYLALLDDFFDAMAGAVMDHGGEVLKFIGDAVLAIYPIDDPTSKQPMASTNAIAAVRAAEERLALLNQDRRTKGQPVLGYGISLHRGDLTYGNIGASRRLDFTVIGPAVNQAARIQDMCKDLGMPVLLSATFADSFAGKLISFGQHQLRGIGAKQELFTLPPNNAFETAAE